MKKDEITAIEFYMKVSISVQTGGIGFVILMRMVRRKVYTVGV